MTKLEPGLYLPARNETAFRSADQVAAWLASQGYTVAQFGEAKSNRYGFADTACGFRVSTNGYVCRVPGFYAGTPAQRLLRA